MSKKTHVYKVTSNGKHRLIRALTKAQAIRHVANDTISAALAEQQDMFDLATAGVKIEDAGAEADAE